MLLFAFQLLMVDLVVLPFVDEFFEINLHLIGLKETLQNTKHHLCECELKFLEISDDFADFKRLSCAIKVWMSRLINEFNLKLIFEKHGHEITKIYINETDQTATITYATPKGFVILEPKTTYAF